MSRTNASNLSEIDKAFLLGQAQRMEKPFSGPAYGPLSKPSLGPGPSSLKLKTLDVGGMDGTSR